MKNIQKYITLSVRLLLGTIFIFAAVDKIVHPHQFQIVIENYQIVPPLLSHYTAMFLPWFEIICGLLLIIGIYVETSAGLLGGLLVVFIIALVSALVRGLDINCGCFTLSAKGSAVSVYRILEDLLMLGMSFYLLFYYKSFRGIQES